MKRILNIQPKGPYAPQRPPTLKEQLAASERMLEALYPRPGPPPKPYIHVAGLPKPEPRPALTIKEAMGTVPIARPGGSQ
jgi:hypothetical protein